MSTRKCVICGQPIGEDHPHFNDGNSRRMCMDCALKKGLADPMLWLNANGIGIYHHAEYHDGTIIAFQKWGRGFRKDVITVL